ncbi:MAG: hypothetical protein DRP42_01865 [Tenericutes bacterium]|nr:MAG: hypothetical protein DRP42_01865 [Mycoplasmatota bacterium]
MKDLIKKLEKHTQLKLTSEELVLFENDLKDFIEATKSIDKFKPTGETNLVSSITTQTETLREDVVENFDSSKLTSNSNNFEDGYFVVKEK